MSFCFRIGICYLLSRSRNTIFVPFNCFLFKIFDGSTLFFLYGSPPGPLVVNSIHLPLNTHLRFNQKNSFPMKYLFRNQDGVSDFKTEQPLIPVVVKSLDQMNSTKQALFRNRGQVYFSVDLNENNLTCLPFS